MTLYQLMKLNSCQCEVGRLLKGTVVVYLHEICVFVSYNSVLGTIRTLIIVVSYQPVSEIVPEANGKPTKVLIMIADPKYGLRYLPLG